MAGQCIGCELIEEHMHVTQHASPVELHAPLHVAPSMQHEHAPLHVALLVSHEHTPLHVAPELLDSAGRQVKGVHTRSRCGFPTDQSEQTQKNYFLLGWKTLRKLPLRKTEKPWSFAREVTTHLSPICNTDSQVSFRPLALFVG